MKKASSIKKTLRITVYALSYLLHIRFGCIYLIIQILYSAINAGFTALYIIFPGLLINELIEHSNYTYMLVVATILVFLPFLQKVLGILFDRLSMVLSQKIELIISKKYFSRVCSLDYENLESPDIQLLQERAEAGLNNIVGIVNSVATFCYCAISLFSIATIVVVLHSSVVLLICSVLFINSICTKKVDEYLYDDKKNLDKMYLQQSVFPFMLTNLDYGKEIRIFRLTEYLIEKFANSVNKTNKKERTRTSVRQKLQVICACTSLIQNAVIYGYLIMLVTEHSLSIGDFTIFLNASNQFSTVISQFLNSYLQLSKNSLAIEDMQEFFEMEQKVDQGDKDLEPLDKNSKICFENVCFSYPGSDKLALDHLNLSISLDERLCIVGENGSGKSTMTKLLMRLYTPTEGRITINGVDIQSIHYDTYRRIFSSVFQDFSILSLSLKENIVLTCNENQKKLNNVICQVGLDKLVNNLEKGLDTCLDKEIDETGITLSGGEAQKMAIARALYQGGTIYILDEPTAALDPRAEYEIYTKFREMIADRCAIMITHRLSAVQLADKVAVFADGHVAEYGTHTELYAKGGIYTEMFDKQAQFYRDSVCKIDVSSNIES